MRVGGESSEDEMESKYKMMKRRLKELKNLRITSVLADIEDIKQKISEHQRVHEEAVSHLKHENARLGRLLRNRQAGEDEIARMRESNQEMRTYLAKREPAMEPFIRQGSGFTVKVLRRREFEISDGAELRAKMTRKHDEVICHFLSAPEVWATQKGTEFAKPDNLITFAVSDLPQFCARIRKVRNAFGR